jgi:hypothetical protein
VKRANDYVFCLRRRVKNRQKMSACKGREQGKVRRAWESKEEGRVGWQQIFEKTEDLRREKMRRAGRGKREKRWRINYFIYLYKK